MSNAIAFFAGFLLGAAGTALVLIALIWAVKTAKWQDDGEPWPYDDNSF